MAAFWRNSWFFLRVSLRFSIVSIENLRPIPALAMFARCSGEKGSGFLGGFSLLLSSLADMCSGLCVVPSFAAAIFAFASADRFIPVCVLAVLALASSLLRRPLSVIERCSLSSAVILALLAAAIFAFVSGVCKTPF